MITNFESITYELTEDEKTLLPILIAGFKTHSKDTPIKAPEIVSKVNQYFADRNVKARLSEPRLRKMCNFIRANSLLPLIATSHGYYISHDPQDIRLQVLSLRERAASINNCADGLEVFIPHPQSQQGILFQQPDHQQ